MPLKNIAEALIGKTIRRCPDCDAVINAEDMNIKQGVALCPNCGRLCPLSELIQSRRPVQEVLAKPPSGCSIESDGMRAVFTASMRSIGAFIGILLFALFWNGIVSMFVLLAIAGLYANIVGPLPAWFPAPGIKAGKPEMNGAPMGLGETLFLCVFLIPFVTIGLGMAIAALVNLLGKVKVVIDEGESFVATGIGIAKWKRRFDAREISAINYCSSVMQSDSGISKSIELIADKTIKFGSSLQSDRLDWLRSVLRDLFLSEEGKQIDSKTPKLNWLRRRS